MSWASGPGEQNDLINIDQRPQLFFHHHLSPTRSLFRLFLTTSSHEILMALTHCISAYVLWHFRGPRIVVISMILFYTPLPRESTSASLGEIPLCRKGMSQAFFSCTSDAVPLVSSPPIERQVYPLRKIFPSMDYLKKYLVLLGGKIELLKKRGGLCGQKRKHFISPVALLFGSRFQEIQMS